MIKSIIENQRTYCSPDSIRELDVEYSNLIEENSIKKYCWGSEKYPSIVDFRQFKKMEPKRMIIHVGEMGYKDDEDEKDKRSIPVNVSIPLDVRNNSGNYRISTNSNSNHKVDNISFDFSIPYSLCNDSTLPSRVLFLQFLRLILSETVVQKMNITEEKAVCHLKSGWKLAFLNKSTKIAASKILDFSVLLTDNVKGDISTIKGYNICTFSKHPINNNKSKILVNITLDRLSIVYPDGLGNSIKKYPLQIHQINGEFSNEVTSVVKMQFELDLEKYKTNTKSDVMVFPDVFFVSYKRYFEEVHSTTPYILL